MALRPIVSDEFDLLNHVEALARRDGHFDFVIHLLADQRTAKRA